MRSTIYSQQHLAGNTIFKEGEEGDVAYIIESGKIEISTNDRGNRVVLGTLGQGQLLGEMAMIDKAPRTATATALEDTTLTVVSREQLHERLASAEPILRMLVELIMSRYRSGLNKVKGTPLANELNAPLAQEHNRNNALNTIRMENDLKKSLQNKELAVYYQPLLDIKRGRWAGFEALIRWTHPERGVVSPIEFITLAEETELILPVGLFVLEKACQDLIQLQTARKRIYPDSQALFVAVNVSSKQIEQINFTDQIADIVHNSGLSPSSLKLEITESMTIDYEAMIRWVSRCKKLGFQIAVDDFGTGYSSLEHLLELNVDTLKIDQAFIRDVIHHEKSKRLVQGIVSLSKSLGYSIVAEGISEEEQLTLLQKMDCDYGQGYYIGKPQTLAEITQQIKDGA